MVKLYALDLRPWQSGTWRALLPDLPPERQQQALSCRFDADSARAAGGGWLLQYALEQAGVPRGDQRLARTLQGKPFLQDRGDLHFSLSHGGTWAVCAVGGAPLGVDVELPRCTLALAKRFFRPEEWQGAEDLELREQLETLTRIWSAKEAFLKALGCGLTMPLDSFGVILGPGGASLDQALTDTPYRLHEYRLDICPLFLCTPEDRPALELVTAV